LRPLTHDKGAGMTTNKKPLEAGEAGELLGTQGVSESQQQLNINFALPQASWPTTGNSAAAQRQRLMTAIGERGSLSTPEARRPDLDIMHPAARIMELRKQGVPIQTVRVPEVSPAGKVHNVARYYVAVIGEEVKP